MQTLHHKILGESGDYLVIVHGLFGSLDNWQTLGKQFSNDFRVVLVDQRNHGKSPHFAVHNYEAMAADLDYLLDELNISQCHLLGHSMGGKTVMQYAVNHPERVLKLIVGDIGPRYYAPHHQLILKTLHSIDFKLVKSRGEIEEKMYALVQNPGIVQFLMKGIGRDDQNNFCWKFNLPVLSAQIENIGEELKYNKPYPNEVLFIAGEKSDYILPEDEVFIAKVFPNYQLQKVSNAGHWLHAENPVEFYNKVIAFLN